MTTVVEAQREQINALVSDKDAQEQILQKMYLKHQKLNEEIALLSRALVSASPCRVPIGMADPVDVDLGYQNERHGSAAGHASSKERLR